MALLTTTLPGLPGGMNLAIPAQELDDTEGRYIQDGLVDKPGVVRSRGPIEAASGVARPTLKGSGLLVCANPVGTGKFAILNGDNSNGYVGLLNEARDTLVNYTWPHALPASPTTHPYKLVDSKPGAQGGAWVGISDRFDAASPSQALAFWYGGDKADYSTGTIAFTGGGTIITGTGTSWLGNVVPGMFVFADVANTAVAITTFSKTLIGVVKSVDSNTQITLLAASPYASSGTTWSPASPTAVTYRIQSMRGFSHRITKGLITCSTSAATVTGGDTKWVQQGMPTSNEASGRTTNIWNVYRLSDGNWVGRVDKCDSDTSMTLKANAAVSLVDEPYIAIRGDATYNLALTDATTQVGWLNAVYAERQFFANLGTDVEGTARLWFSDPNDHEAVDLSTYSGDFIDIPSTVSVVEPIRAMLPTYNALLVFKETETYAVFGNSPTSFNVRKLEDDGVFVPMGVQPYSGGAIWPGRNGLYVYDGVNVTNITTNKLGQYWKDLVRGIDFSLYRCWSMVERNHYFLFFEAADPTVVPRKGNIAQPVNSLTICVNMVTNAFSILQGVNIRGSAIIPQDTTREAWFLVNGADTTRPDTPVGTTAAGTSINSMASNTMYAKKVTATQDGYAASLTWRLDAGGTGSGNPTFRYVLYADAAGIPGAVLAKSDDAALTDGAAAANVTLGLQHVVRITAGTSYWVALQTGTNGDNLRTYREATGGTARWHSDTFSDGPQDPWDDATESNASYDYTAYLNMDYDRAVVCDAESLFNQEGLDVVVADGGSVVDNSPGPDIYVETKKFDIGDGLRLKRFKQFAVWYLAQGGGIHLDAVLGLNEVGTTLTTTLPASVYNWDQLGNLFTSWDDLALEFATWDDIVSAVFLPKRARFSKKSQYFSMRLYRETDQVSRAQFGPFSLGYKVLRPGRV